MAKAKEAPKLKRRATTKPLQGKTVKKELKQLTKVKPVQLKPGQSIPVAYRIAVGDHLGKAGKYPRAVMVETAKPENCQIEIEHVDGTCRVLPIHTMLTSHDIFGQELKKPICCSMLFPVPDKIKRVTKSTSLKTIVFYE